MNNFITIDFETAVYSRDSAISVGLVKYNDYLPVDTFYSLIKPPTLYIRPEFTDIHGLTIDDVKDAPDFKNVWENGLRDFIAGLPGLPGMPIAAHNASFDMSVLKAVLEKYELPIPKLSYFCTCDLARRTWPEFKSHSLTNLAKEFGIEYAAHNALADAETCGKLVQMSAEKFGAEKAKKGLTIPGLLRKARLKMRVLK